MLLALLCLSLPAAGEPEIVELRLGGQLIRAEIPNTQESRVQGLMHRKTLCENCGMLFVFPQAGRHGFWMKNTLIPLSIAFLSSNGSILRIADMQPGSEEMHEGPEGTLYALEMRAGWFALKGIGVRAALHDMKMVEYFQSMAQ
jgi:hypothetical protein